jgi:hypothetical protein
MRFDRDALPDRPTLVGMCPVCRWSVSSEDEYEEFGLGIEDVVHKECLPKLGPRPVCKACGQDIPAGFSLCDYCRAEFEVY